MTTQASTAPRSAAEQGARASAGVSDEAVTKEYFALFDAVREFDKNLLVVKGWGATVFTGTLVIGFQAAHYGIFLVAALAGAAFWTIEAAMKRHQMRHYVRMREIECQRAAPPAAGTGGQSTPQIDWSWTIAPDYLKGTLTGPPPPPDRYQKSLTPVYLFWAYPHVALPHALAVIVGTALFLLGSAGRLPFGL